jgi:hypothetical protein
MKIHCPRCNTDKIPSLFRVHKTRASGKEAYCRECSNRYQREWSNTPEHKEKARTRQRRGFTQVQADSLLAVQGGICPICATKDPGKNGWHMDHNHVTGVVRGMLCSNCNRGIGHLKDSAVFLRKAAEYIERHG